MDLRFLGSGDPLLIGIRRGFKQNGASIVVLILGGTGNHKVSFIHHLPPWAELWRGVLWSPFPAIGRL